MKFLEINIKFDGVTLSNDFQGIRMVYVEL